LGAQVRSGTPGDLTDGAEPQYLIQPGDVLDIRVDVGRPDFHAPFDLMVGPDGAFAYPEVGEVRAQGRTRHEIAGEIADAMKRLYRNVEVIVNIQQYHPRQIYVLGEVVKPGPVPVVGEGLPIAEALARVGGRTDKASDAILYRGDEEPRTLAMAGDVGLADGEILEPGDTLFVGERQPLIVVGEVARPGPVSLRRDARLTHALAAAGGVGPDADSRNAALIDYENNMTVVDLDAILQTPNGELDLPIAGYHTLVVPPRQAIAVIGEVKSPGLRTVAHGMRLTDVISQAGGLTDNASLTISAVDSTGQTLDLDLGAALNQPGGEADVPAHDLRTVVVPEERREIIVVGEVSSPGVVRPAALPVTLTMALALAEGVTADAEVSAILVSRPDGTREFVDATALLRPSLATAGAVATDPLLETGTVISVPLRRAQVAVLGAVRNPGTFTFEAGDAVIDAVALAGGYKEARLARVGLLRRQGDSVEVFEVNLRAGLRGGGEALTTPLQDRDVVVVPRGNKIDWSKIATLVFGVSTVLQNFGN
jgi:protein involved in polysaccharide export with SLBB domain